MRYFWLVILATAVALSLWAADWPMPGGNPQRNGWAGSEQRLTRANISALKLLYKYQTDNRSNGPDSLTTPVVSGNLITYRGFKEMLMFAGSSGKVFAVDADLNRLLWETDLTSAASNQPGDSSGSACPGGLSAPVVMAGSSSSSLHFAALASRAPAATGARPSHSSPYFPPLSQSVYPLLPTTLTELNALYAVSSDGYLHVLNSSTGQQLIPSVRFVPPRAKVISLNIRDNVVYATTGDNCDGYRNALFAIDLLSPQKTVTSFVAPRGDFSGTAGTTIGNDGTVYVQSAYAPPDRPGHFYEAVIALAPKTLTLKDYFALSDKPLTKTNSGEIGITPVVFSSPNRDLIIAGGRNGRLYLLDSRSLGGANHRTPLFASDTLVQTSKKCEGDGFRGAFSTWMDVDTGTRKFYAPVFGKVRPPAGLKVPTDGTGDGFILALELQGSSEQPRLRPLWVSRAVASPAPAVIANSMVFVLATGEFSCPARKDKAKTHLPASADLFVFDAITGKQLYSSGNTGAGTSLSAGLAFANGRAYFTARDNAVYCFGVPGQQTQLTEQ